MNEQESNNDTAPGQQDPTLIVYCRTWCGDCMRAKRWLESKGISYVEVDVDQDAKGRQRAEEHNFGRLHTPTFECGDEVCVDFHPDAVLRMLNLE